MAKNWLRAKDGTVSPKLEDDRMIRWMSVIGEWEEQNTWKDVATMLIQKGIEAWKEEKDSKGKPTEQTEESGQVTLAEYMADKQDVKKRPAAETNTELTERRKKVARWYNVLKDVTKVADTVGIPVDLVKKDLNAIGALEREDADD